MGIHLKSYGVTYGHLHSPPLTWDNNCILSISLNCRECHFTRTPANWDWSRIPLRSPSYKVRNAVEYFLSFYLRLFFKTCRRRSIKQIASFADYLNIKSPNEQSVLFSLQLGVNISWRYRVVFISLQNIQIQKKLNNFERKIQSYDFDCSCRLCKLYVVNLWLL